MARIFKRDTGHNISYSVIGDTPLKTEEYGEPDLHPYGGMNFNIYPSEIVPTTMNKTKPDLSSGFLHPDYVDYLLRGPRGDEISGDMEQYYRAHDQYENAKWLHKQSIKGPETLQIAMRKDRRKAGIDLAKEKSTLNKRDWMNPTQLFVQTEPILRAGSAGVHSSLRPYVPVIAADVLRTTGIPTITADYSLSKHSSALVRHAIQKGLPVQAHQSNPDAGVTNDEDFYDEENVIHISDLDTTTSGMLEMSPEERRTSKKFLVDTMKKASTPPPTPMPVQLVRKLSLPQFAQTKLPGMENY